MSFNAILYLHVIESCMSLNHLSYYSTTKHRRLETSYEPNECIIAREHYAFYFFNW